MQKKRIAQNVAIIVLAVAIIVMSVGYATYNTPLQIKGTTTIEKASWDIHFEDPTTVASTTTVADEDITGPTLTEGATKLTFAVNLTLGEKYEFLVDVKNAGTINAKITDVSMTGQKTAPTAGDLTVSGTTYENDYLRYNVTWEDGSAIAVGDKLAADASKKIKVSVEYFQSESDPNGEKLPEEDETYVFTVDMTYTQDNA